jgi:non-heme chloroperoxidase
VAGEAGPAGPGSPVLQLRHIRSRDMSSPPQSRSDSTSALSAGAGGVGSGGRRLGRGRNRLVFVGAVFAAVGATGVAHKRLAARRRRDESVDDVRLALGWGEGVERPDHAVVRTPDGAQLAVWDLEGDGPDAPVVVLPHCWGCSHEVWLPVARRLKEQGFRVVLYDQRGHGASSRGTAPLTIETLAHDLTAVLDATDVRDAVLAGHSMGGMTIMSLATHRPDVLKERAKAAVLVATAATSLGTGSVQGARMANALVASPLVTRAMQSKNGHVFVRRAFGENPVRSHMDLTRELFGGCHGAVRGDFLLSMSTMDLLEGVSTMEVPTTVMVGTRDALTLPKKADQIVATVPGARLVTLQNRGHMLPLEDPDAVTDEIVRAVKG